MNAIVAAFAACSLLAVVNASGYVASPSAKIIQGPSTKTTVVGPDGSSISAVAPGGSIVTEEQPGVVAQTYAAPVSYATHPIGYAANAAYAAPVSYSAPVSYAAAVPYAASAPYVAHTSYAAPVAYPHHAAYAASGSYGTSGIVAHDGFNTLVAGPSGTISTTESVVGGPAIYSHAAPVAYSGYGYGRYGNYGHYY